MFSSFKNKFIVILMLLSLESCFCYAQQTQVVLEHGAIAGLKVFPDSSRSAVFAFLGVPYAQPPVGELRFAPPRPHNGWNWTLQAKSLKSICPQLTNTIYDETADGTFARPADMSEDCLYLNIWVPETEIRFGNLPVLVIITGEAMSYDWPRNRAFGFDLASEGIVVINVQYRTNIFGWINLLNEDLSGNYGLQDQELALKWIQRNIPNFGGDPKKITLLGHGTSGATCVMALSLTQHLSKEMFSKIILMSPGDMIATLNQKNLVQETSRSLVQKLGCHFEENGNQLLSCLRMKSVSDLQKAFESIYDHGNGTLFIGPVLPISIKDILSNGTMNSLSSILIGITSNEGAFLQDYWLDLARESYQALRSYVNFTVLPSVMRKLSYNSALPSEVVNALKWRYFSGEAALNSIYLINAMQRLISEFFYETPFYQTLETLKSNNATESKFMYAYVFDFSNSMDMRGRINLFGGASHSSDLPLLLGPSLFQQISRRRLTINEEKLCRKIRNVFANFIKSGHPTSGNSNNEWLPYRKENKFVFNLGTRVEIGIGTTSVSSLTLDNNLEQIEKMLEPGQSNDIGTSRQHRNEFNNLYQYKNIDSNNTDSHKTKFASFKKNQQDSGYALHLKRIYGFWHVLTPNMVTFDNDTYYDGLHSALSYRIRLLEASADALRYKQGFFAMLGLVAVLLAILGLCVYLLRRDSLHLSTQSNGFCL